MSEVLLTGATGFLGKVVLHELLRRREELGVARVHVVVRPKRGASAADRFRAQVLGSPCFSRLAAGWDRHVAPVEADLAAPGAGLDPEARAALRERLTHIVHCAASVEFHLPIREAAAANVTSALGVLELAKACPRLVSHVDVSTAYVTPHPGDGVPVREELAPLRIAARTLYPAILASRYDRVDHEAGLLAENGHPNTYTFTKCLAEHLLAERRGAVPLTLVRPSIISASLERPFAGWIDSPAAFALFAMMVGTGRMRALIARPRARLDIVPVDVVAARVIAAAFDPPASDAPPRIWHAVSGLEHSQDLGTCAAQVERWFRRNPAAKGRGPVPRIGYLGPDGLRYRLNHLLHHRWRAAARPVAERVAETNRRFAYFTHCSFSFESSIPLDHPGFDAGAYMDVISAGIYRHLLGGDESEVPLAGRGHRRSRGDLLWALRQPEGNAVIRLAGWLVAKALRRCVDRVTVDAASFRAARAAAPHESVLVLAPSHRSYLDFVLISFLCFARPDLGIAIPHVAAAVEFARIPLLGWLFRRMHAFYLQRGQGREDKALTRQVHDLVREGRTLEFFIEGRRSRSRRFLEPRRGFLRSLQATGHRVALLPIAVSYDHVAEEATLLSELTGGEKPPMRLRDLAAWCLRLARGEIELGRIHVACGRPVALDLRGDVHDAAREVMAELQARTVTTTHHLRSFLANAGLEGIDVAWLARAIARRGGRVLEAPRREHAVPAVIERCMRYQFSHCFHPEAALAFAGNPAAEHHVRRNGWAPGHALDAEAELADPRVRDVLRALFEPVCSDYAATASALARLRAAGARTAPEPAALVRELAGAHLPDVEGACEDLLERGLLSRTPEGDAILLAGRAEELAAYAMACRTPLLDPEAA